MTDDIIVAAKKLENLMSPEDRAIRQIEWELSDINFSLITLPVVYDCGNTGLTKGYKLLWDKVNGEYGVLVIIPGDDQKSRLWRNLNCTIKKTLFDEVQNGLLTKLLDAFDKKIKSIETNELQGKFE